MCAIDEVESPEKVFSGSICVVPARVVRKVLAERRSLELLHKQIDLVQEEDDTRSHEPAGVDDGVKEHKGFDHSVLQEVLLAATRLPGDQDETVLDCSPRAGPGRIHSRQRKI